MFRKAEADTSGDLYGLMVFAQYAQFYARANASGTERKQTERIKQPVSVGSKEISTKIKKKWEIEKEKM